MSHQPVVTLKALLLERQSGELLQRQQADATHSELEKRPHLCLGRRGLAAHLDTTEQCTNKDFSKSLMLAGPVVTIAIIQAI